MMITEAREEIKKRESSVQELRLPVGRLRFQEDRLIAGDAELRLQGAGLGRFCKRLKAPVDYVQTLSPFLRAAILQHHLDRGDLGHQDVIVFNRAGHVVGVDDPRLARLRNTEVLDAVVVGWADSQDLLVHDLQFGEDSFQLKLICLSKSDEVFPGDVVQAGIEVMHSDTGEYATSLQAFLYRLVCQNGMTHRDCLRRRAARTRRLPAAHPNAKQLQIAQVQRLAAEVRAGLDTKLRVLQKLREEEVKVEDLFPRWLERARLSPKNLMPLLLQAWQEEGSEATAYGAMNALTRVSSHSPRLSDRIRRILAGLAGILAFRHEHLCPHCFSLLRGPVASCPDNDVSPN